MPVMVAWVHYQGCMTLVTDLLGAGNRNHLQDPLYPYDTSVKNYPLNPQVKQGSRFDWVLPHRT
jgi:hypothetical protein